MFHNGFVGDEDEGDQVVLVMTKAMKMRIYCTECRTENPDVGP